MFILIFGITWKYRKKRDGVQLNKYCPGCQGNRLFMEVVPTKYITLFWLPVIPIQKIQTVLECQNCNEKIHDHTSCAFELELDGNIHEDYTSSKYECANCDEKMTIIEGDGKTTVLCPSCKSGFKIKSRIGE